MTQRCTVLTVAAPVAFAVTCALSLVGCGASSAKSSETIAPTQATEFVVAYVSTTTLPTTTTIALTPTELSLPASGTIPTSVDGAATAAASDGTYTIQGGDSMLLIAKSHGMTVDELVALNGWKDGADHLLLPGKTIKVAVGGPTTGASNTGATSTTSVPAQTGQGCSYTIQSGDNPSSVASQYGITVTELRAANPGGVMDTFLVGAKLKIPANGNC